MSGSKTPRKARKTPRNARPFSIRLTTPERATLEAKAGGTPLGIFARRVLLDGDFKPRVAPGGPVADRALLARLLGLLGQSRLASNLNQLAKATNTGLLPVTPETESELRRACAEISEMRTLLLQGLGVVALQSKSAKPGISENFSLQARGLSQ